MNGFTHHTFHKNSQAANPAQWEQEDIMPELMRIPNCDCGQPANLKVCQTTEKGNYGKQYYVCANKKAEDRCKFFCWFDEVEKKTKVQVTGENVPDRSRPYDAKTLLSKKRKGTWSPQISDEDENPSKIPRKSPPRTSPTSPTRTVDVTVKKTMNPHVFDDPEQLRLVALNLLQQRISEDNICLALKNQLNELQREINIIKMKIDHLSNEKKPTPLSP